MIGRETDPKAMSMRELLHMEVDAQSRVLIDTLLELEQGDLTDKHLETLMRAAHSMKGGARIAELQPAVELAHSMEDLFVAAREGQTSLQREQVDLLLQATDLLIELARVGAHQDTLPVELIQRTDTMRNSVLAIAENPPPPVEQPGAEAIAGSIEPVADEQHTPGAAERMEETQSTQPAEGRTVRVNIESMNQLMALIGELRVMNKTSASVRAESLLSHRRLREIKTALGDIKSRLVDLEFAEFQISGLDEITAKIDLVDEFLIRSSGTLENHDARSEELVRLMQHGVMAHRMQPFGDAAQGFKRLVRQLAKTLGKQVTLEVSGAEVGVDRDILERLNAPLTHMIQNAVDHGIRSPDERIADGKPATGSIVLSAQHRGGLLSVVVEDDGEGIDLEKVRQRVVSNKLVNESVAASLQEHELLEFLFLPNFTMSQQLSDISGRGVGLDLVRHALQEVRGSVRIATRAGKGTRFEMSLPVTLVVVRCMVVEIAGELFALPLGRTSGALVINYDSVQSLENRQHMMLDGRQVGLVIAAEILQITGGKPRPEELSLVVLTKDQQRYGLVVDKLLGERQMVERPLDARLGKVENITSVSMLDDGSPVLILDVDDLLLSIERISSERALGRVGKHLEGDQVVQGKRVLVVDDSITVREVERGLLSMQGYQVVVAVDGAESWNALRTGDFDLVVTDVDMPRMNGIELVKLIRADARLKDIPVIIVSYKDRDEDRLNGMDAGADRYLTKGSFQDDTFIDTVSDLIGTA